MLNEAEILRLIQEDRLSDRKYQARQGLRYYRGEHDILNYQLYYYDGDGNLVQDKFKSNIRIAHPFFTELVDQQVQYMLSGGKMLRSDIPDLQQELDQRFDEDFYAEIYELLQGAIIKGFEYLYGVVDARGRLRFACGDSLGTVEVREKDTDAVCSCYIFHYAERVDRGQTRVHRVQIWDREGVRFYVSCREGELLPDNCIPTGDGRWSNWRPHAIYTDGEGRQFGKGFGFIPFWRLDNGKEQSSGLRPIKGLIDDYDLMACSLSNNLQDFTDAIYVVSGYQGGNLDEMIHNLKAKKHIGVDGDGGVEIKTVNIPYEARVAKLDLDEKNIYRFGMGFHASQKGDGNITNVVIKSRYALLDLKCNRLEIRLKQLLRKLLEVVLPEINSQKGTAYGLQDVYFDFKRQTMTNATDNAEIEKTQAQRREIELGYLKNLTDTLGEDRVYQMICETLDITPEIRKEQNP